MKCAIFAFATIIALLVAEIAGHACLLSPLQRHSVDNVNVAGAAECNLTTGPCGDSSPATEPRGIYKSGQNVTVVYQKVWSLIA